MTLYTWATKYERKKYLKGTAIYGAVGAFCMLFSYIYSFFSHGVSSPYMTYMCLYPLIGGALLCFVLWALRFPGPEGIAINTYRSGLATLTVGSCIHGIMFIAGTSTPLQVVYTALGIGLTGLGIWAYIIGLIRRR